MTENAPAAGWEDHDHEGLVHTHRHFHVIGIGDTAARAIASQQPVKFASMEYVPPPGAA